MTGFKTLTQTGLVLAVGQQLSLALRSKSARSPRR